jgi:hypothetical protein
MRKLSRPFQGLPAWLPWAAVALCASFQPKLLGAATRLDVLTDGAAIVAETKQSTLPAIGRNPWLGRSAFESAILRVPTGVDIPEQGPWTISAGDIKQPMGFTVDLVEHRQATFSFLWDKLSKETQLGLATKYKTVMAPPGGAYKPGPELDALVADLNKLIQGPSFFDETRFGTVCLSGDTLKLLEEKPAGAVVARLNRLLLEDAFQLDIIPRAKIQMDPITKNYVFIDFSKKVISSYDQRGAKMWTANMGSTLAESLRNWPYSREPVNPAGMANTGIWDLFFQGDSALVRIRGNYSVRISMKTGSIIALPHL